MSGLFCALVHLHLPLKYKKSIWKYTHRFKFKVYHRKWQFYIRDMKFELIMVKKKIMQTSMQNRKNVAIALNYANWSMWSVNNVNIKKICDRAGCRSRRSQSVYFNCKYTKFQIFDIIENNQEKKNIFLSFSDKF